MQLAFSVDPAQLIQLVSAVLMPLVVGLVTKQLTPGATKAWLLAGLTLVASLLSQLGTAIGGNVPFDVGLALISAIPAFTISVASYYGLWKPTGVGAAAQDVDVTTLPGLR